MSPWRSAGALSESPTREQCLSGRAAHSSPFGSSLHSGFGTRWLASVSVKYSKAAEVELETGRV
jgi:hypothetical protein